MDQVLAGISTPPAKGQLSFIKSNKNYEDLESGPAL